MMRLRTNSSVDATTYLVKDENGESSWQAMKEQRLTDDFAKRKTKFAAASVNRGDGDEKNSHDRIMPLT